MSKMRISEDQIEQIRSYFHNFTVALEAHLRLLKGSLQAYWGRIDSNRFSTLIYVTNEGIVARVLPKWLGSYAVVKRNVSFHDATISDWAENSFNNGDQVFASVLTSESVLRELRAAIQGEPVE